VKITSKFEVKSIIKPTHLQPGKPKVIPSANPIHLGRRKRSLIEANWNTCHGQ